MDELLGFEKAKSITKSNETNYKKYIDSFVLPGMVLQLPSASKQNRLWTLGPGLAYLPKYNSPQDFVLVRQLGVLRYQNEEVTPVAASSSTSHQSVKKTNDDDAITAAAVGSTQKKLWVERISLPAGNSVGGVAAPLARINPVRCPLGSLRVGDRVVGVVVKKVGDAFLVDVGAQMLANIRYTAFDGASKKNRPDVRPGDVLYACVAQADRDLDIELTCLDLVSGQTASQLGLGVLGRYRPGTVGNAAGQSGGVLLSCSPGLARRLADVNTFPLLHLLSKRFPFEVCVGANGRLWLTARTPRESVVLANSIAVCEHLPNDVCCRLVAELC